MTQFQQQMIKPPKQLQIKMYRISNNNMFTGKTELQTGITNKSDITFAGDGNEEGPCQVRFPWSVNQPKEDFLDDPSDNWPMSATHNTL